MPIVFHEQRKALLFQRRLCKRYFPIVCDDCGHAAHNVPLDCAATAGIEAIALLPHDADFNVELMARGVETLRANILPHLNVYGAQRFFSADASSKYEI